ncbi:MAG: hypothetical protein IPN64_13845 [Propionivibrio sp.]|uniref:hypothetical protein n=1 Tax=Propionivibrio sp. TaxID=2212460 RepID=UPI0025D11D13|nr:hypothetical protein [Propionivibrio sp.]MBK8895065.1 hypothetical protein [Propionivibrio sp.]
MTGNLTQSGSGVSAFDLSLARLASDRLDVAGSARTGGGIRLNPIDTGYARPGTQQRVMLSASGGVVNDGLLLSAPSSPIVRYDLSFPSGNEIAVRSSIDFAPATLGFNARQIGKQVNAIQNAGGSSSFAPYAASLIAQPDNASLNVAYEKLGPGALGSLSSLSMTSSLDFQEAMHSCRQREGEYRFIHEGNADGCASEAVSETRSERP